MRPSRNRAEKSRIDRGAPAGGPALTRRKEKYSNLLFLGFNAVFLVALFWMLPALGTDYPRPSAQAGAPAQQTNAMPRRAVPAETVNAGPNGPLVQFARLDFRPLR